MLIIGVILIIVGLLVASLHVLVVIGAVIAAIALLLILLGAVGRPVGGRRHWF